LFICSSRQFWNCRAAADPRRSGIKEGDEIILPTFNTTTSGLIHGKDVAGAIINLTQNGGTRGPYSIFLSRPLTQQECDGSSPTIIHNLPISSMRICFEVRGR
jgi:hypothetical protein